MSSQPSTPAEDRDAVPPVSPNGVAAGLEKAILNNDVPPSTGGLGAINTSGSPPPGSPSSPTSPGGFRRGHNRQASLGTTMTSPSTRRRSLESTMSLIQGVWDGQEQKIAEGDEVEGLVDRFAGSFTNNAGTKSGAPAPTAAR